MATDLPAFDKYFYYSQAVQSPAEDVAFFVQVYREARGNVPTNLVMREDFCSTAAMCMEWVKLGSGFKAIGLDLDPEPLEYARSKYIPALTDDQKKRVSLRISNVLSEEVPEADMIIATNFSYFIFKERATLKSYFTNALKTLKKDGVFVLDVFGGSKCHEANEEETEYEDGDYSYFWDQDTYDPINNNAMFYIHFQRKGEAKREKVFTYDWRIWSIPELRDLLYEVGFKEVHVYWEGTDDEGEGDGEFARVTQGEECETWICYLACVK